MKTIWEDLAEGLRSNKENGCDLEPAELVARMGCLLIDAVMAAHRLAAVNVKVYRPNKEYPRVPERELAEALVFVLEDGLREPFDVNRLKEIVSLYRSQPPDRWIEAFGWRPNNRKD